VVGWFKWVVQVGGGCLMGGIWWAVVQTKPQAAEKR